MIRNIFGSKKSSLKARGRKSHNCIQKFIIFTPRKYYSDDKVKKYQIDKTLSMHGEQKNAYIVLVGT